VEPGAWSYLWSLEAGHICGAWSYLCSLVIFVEPSHICGAWSLVIFVELGGWSYLWSLVIFVEPGQICGAWSYLWSLDKFVEPGHIPNSIGTESRGQDLTKVSLAVDVGRRRTKLRKRGRSF
jgi:hypothetical protein